MIPKCTSWRGHKFEARYSTGPGRKLTEPEMWHAWPYDLTTLSEKTRRKTYECDVCVRCGHVVQKPQ